jgi:hypothetical protein
MADGFSRQFDIVTEKVCQPYQDSGLANPIA